MSTKFGLFFLAFFFVMPSVWAKETLILEGRLGKFFINPETLAVSIDSSESSSNIFKKVSLTSKGQFFGTAQILKNDESEAQWYYPALQILVKVRVDEKGLDFLFKTVKEQSINWPIAGSTWARALIIPDGEGLYIPNHDPFWRKVFNKYPFLFLSLPFWAIEQGDHSYISYIWVDPSEHTQVKVKEKNGQLYLSNVHHFLKRAHFPAYRVLIHLTGESPISPALDYRNFLINENRFVSLKRKILENANVNKLLGAFHIWDRENGKNMELLDDLERLGIKHALINYVVNSAQNNQKIKEYVHHADEMGFLVGPYDSFVHAQNPKISTNLISTWPNHLWIDACIRDHRGHLFFQFISHSCYLSSEALRFREATEKNIENQIDKVLDRGANTLFLDSDAARPFYEDCSAQHPMTHEQDLRNRLSRMRYISSIKKLVLGSETGLAWFAGVIAYNNGAFFTFTEEFESLLKARKYLEDGRWFDDDMASFNTYPIPQELVQTSYNPYYRLPLYETVFHDSVVSTDHWEFHELRSPLLIKTKALLQNLYNIPPIWVLDKNTLKANADYFFKYYAFFSPIHQMAGLEALTRFQWLTEDHLVQQTQFGNRVSLIANFSQKRYKEIEPNCIEAIWLEDNSKTFFCPRK